jgi:hypothetical protein
MSSLQQPHQERKHMMELVDPVIEHQRFTNISYIIPGFNCDPSSRPGIMIRGSFPDEESATRHAKALKIKSLNVYSVETGKAIPSCPTVEEMESVPRTYVEEELNEIVGGISKRNAEADKAFEEHCSTMRDTKSESPETIERSIDLVMKEVKDKLSHVDFLKSELKKLRH